MWASRQGKRGRGSGPINPLPFLPASSGPPNWATAALPSDHEDGPAHRTVMRTRGKRAAPSRARLRGGNSHGSHGRGQLGAAEVRVVDSAATTSARKPRPTQTSSSLAPGRRSRSHSRKEGARGPAAYGSVQTARPGPAPRSHPSPATWAGPRSRGRGALGAAQGRGPAAEDLQALSCWRHWYLVASTRGARWGGAALYRFGSLRWRAQLHLALHARCSARKLLRPYLRRGAATRTWMSRARRHPYQ
eukprot:scaffold589_cov343-Prasinococcus_capsulatus_cf.AAC.1